MWPLCFISDKLFKVAGDGGEGPDAPPPPDGQIPLARRSYCVDVPHVQQAFTWDCGLACVLMVLRALGVDCCDGIADLEKLCRTTSIWTVDLAYLLHKFSVSFSFFTVTLGANPQYSAETFYREQLQEDIDRVDELFGKALDAGIRHYVVICGYDADACEFEIRDPASSRKHERVPMKSLDEARKSFGTDEDILLVSLTGKNEMKRWRRLLVGSL